MQLKTLTILALSVVAISTMAQADTKKDLKTCAMEQAAKLIENHNAFSKSFKTNVNTISTNCLTELSLSDSMANTIQATTAATSALKSALNDAEK